MSDTESYEANNEEEVGYVVVSNRRHPPSIVFQSTVRASLRREALGRRGQATQQVSRLQRILPQVDTYVSTLQVEIDNMGSLPDLAPEYNEIAALLNGIATYYDQLYEEMLLAKFKDLDGAILEPIACKNVCVVLSGNVCDCVGATPA